MKTVPIEQVSPGAKVAEDIRDPAGAVLLPRGGELDERLIAILRAKNISEVTLVTQRSPEEQAALAAQVRECLDGRFQNVAGDPLMEGLKQMIFEYRCGEQA